MKMLLLQLLFLVVFLPHPLVATALVDSCTVNGHDLSLIPGAELGAEEENADGGGTGINYTWSILVCQNRDGYVKKSLATVQEKMTLSSVTVEGDDLLLRFDGDGVGSSLMDLTLGCGGSAGLTWPEDKYTVKRVGTALRSKYTAKVLTSVVCTAAKSSGGCGSGCAFVVIFFVGLVVYILATVLWYYLRNGKRGVDLIPHREFWADFPYLLKDGALYAYSKIAGCFGGGTRVATYEEIY
ncbi:hypothetical protein DQ04_00031210 [Trypanosoma grayi]|uniref:hypothetical protein n=1 Tax=Trypanosoma grayi TaxID=71804 RepID=UPI0004F449C8|nr:hypothetical protein DQ04_00031210 [Trypanosoma grayi]KEG15587.1 hypothetical protein DQ04_00031210 [Trypanosoma grayi]